MNKESLRVHARSLGRAAVVSSVLVLPLLVLELGNRCASQGDFPSFLFAVLWVLPSACIVIATPIARAVKEGQPFRTPLLLGAACVIPLVWAWLSLVIDQMPCFLGVANCD